MRSNFEIDKSLAEKKERLHIPPSRQTESIVGKLRNEPEEGSRLYQYFSIWA